MLDYQVGLRAFPGFWLKGWRAGHGHQKFTNSRGFDLHAYRTAGRWGVAASR